MSRKIIFLTMARTSDGNGNESYTCDECGKYIGSKCPSTTYSEGFFKRQYHFCSEGHKSKFVKENLSNSSTNNSGNKSNSESNSSNERKSPKSSSNSSSNSGPGFFEKIASADLKNAEVDRVRQEQEYLMKERFDSKIKDIASIQFGNSKEEIINIVEQLIVQGANLSVPKERKAVSDKLELGINKLKQQGVDCSYYEEKNKKIKPTIWQKIAYYFANN
jgi:hypothetical protein